MNDLRTLLLDIVKHTGGLGFIDVVKISTTEDGFTKIEAMDEEKSVIVSGTLKETEERFIGTFGMSKLSVLKGFAEFANFKADDSTIEITTRDRNGSLAAEEIIFKDAQGQTAHYRLMNGDLVPAQAKFVGANWGVTMTPTKSKIHEFSQLATVLSTFETFFFPQITNGELRFYIGEDGGANHGAFVIFDNETAGKLKEKLYWPISQVLTLLKLSEETETILSISDDGALQLELESEFASWKYILPARMK